MELEKMKKMDASYVSSKTKLKVAQALVSTSSEELKNLKRTIESENGRAAELERQADDPLRKADRGKLLNQAKDHRNTAKKCEKEIIIIETLLEDTKKEITSLKEKINAQIAEVMKDPNVKKELETALEKRKERAAKKVMPLVDERDKKEKENKFLTAKKDRLEKIALAIKKKPELKKAFEDCLKVQEEKTKLEKELETCTDDKRELAIRRRISEIDKKDMLKASGNLLKETGKEKLEIKLEDIKYVVESGLILGKDGSIDLEQTLKKSDKSLGKKIKEAETEIGKLNKKIEPYKDIIEKIKKKESEKGDPAKGDPAKSDPAKGDPAKGDSSDKPKWWEFRKRFSAWNEKRKAKKDAKPLPEPEGKSFEAARAEMMKNIIVKDAYDQMAKGQNIETRTHVKENEGR